MRAIVQDRYGSPDQLRLADVDPPTLEADRALIQVRAASVNAQDWRRVRADPFLIRGMYGLRRPSNPLLGADAAGVVEAVGANITHLSPGDEVMGFRSGAFAEYVAGRMFVPKPANLSFEEAAAVPVAGGTALIAVRDKGELQAGQSVLITGAGGGVGTFAVQIASALGADVTATTSPANLDLVGSLGAARVVDYTRTDVGRLADRFDLIIDIGGAPPMGRLLRLLSPAGRFVQVGASKGGGGPMRGLLEAAFRRRVRGQPIISFIADITLDHLRDLSEMIEAGRLRPVIDRSYPLAEVPTALAYVERGQARGKVVISVP